MKLDSVSPAISTKEDLAKAVKVAAADYSGKEALKYITHTHEVILQGQDYARYTQAIPWDLSGKSVLDIGCGNGVLTTDSLLHRNPDKVLGIDYSTDFIEATSHVNDDPRLKFRFMDMHKMDLPSDSQDVVVSRYCLHYSPDLQLLFGEIARVMNKAGGELIFITNMARPAYERRFQGISTSSLPLPVLQEKWIPIVLDEHVTVHNLVHSERDYCTAMRRAGFTILEFERKEGNYKVGNSYKYQTSIDLNEVVVRARLAEDSQ